MRIRTSGKNVNFGDKKIIKKKERKAKLYSGIKEFNDELLNVVKIQAKMGKIWSINEQQVIKIDELYDEMWKFDESIKSSEML